jgi:hypothetical protein
MNLRGYANGATRAINPNIRAPSIGSQAVRQLAQIAIWRP